MGSVCATTLEKLSLDEMIAKSTLIVRGKIAESHAVRRGQLIYTVYRLDVAEQIKGASTRSVEVSVPGGSLNGTRQSFAGTPAMRQGQEYAVFIWTSSQGVNHIIGLSQGLFDAVKGADGKLQLKRGALDARVIDGAGREVASQPLSMSWSELAARVRASHGGAAQ
jgi:hypothetical protein